MTPLWIRLVSREMLPANKRPMNPLHEQAAVIYRPIDQRRMYVNGLSESLNKPAMATYHTIEDDTNRPWRKQQSETRQTVVSVYVDYCSVPDHHMYHDMQRIILDQITKLVLDTGHELDSDLFTYGQTGRLCKQVVCRIYIT